MGTFIQLLNATNFIVCYKQKVHTAVIQSEQIKQKLLYNLNVFTFVLCSDRTICAQFIHTTIILKIYTIDSWKNVISTVLK